MIETPSTPALVAGYAVSLLGDGQVRISILDGVPAPTQETIEYTALHVAAWAARELTTARIQTAMRQVVRGALEAYFAPPPVPAPVLASAPPRRRNAGKLRVVPRDEEQR